MRAELSISQTVVKTCIYI